jgi:hydrogenase expression/formation protein HypD
VTLKHLSEYQSRDICRGILSKIESASRKPVRLMEVCGTHTMSISRNGIRGLLPETVTLLSGPGCPVCVTSQGEIDRFIRVSRIKDVIVTTFGDLLRVPSRDATLEKERADGADIRMVYSTLDALDIAVKNPDKEVVFLGIGFETTAPTIAAAIEEANKKGIGNFSVLSANKRVIPALEALLKNDRVKVDGFICPGHVSIIIGGDAYRPVSEMYKIPCVVAGFEPVDILQAVNMLIDQIEKGCADVEIAYSRGVSFEGNLRAREALDRVFSVSDAVWRGIGPIPGSGLAIRDDYSRFDADKKFQLPVEDIPEPDGCACGEILMGIKSPPQCGRFGKTCTPTHPVGPCMVSSEGTCAAYYKYQT